MHAVGCAVLDKGTAVAPVTADQQLPVELLEGARSLLAQLGHGSSAERRTDEAVDQQPVAVTGCLLDLMAGQPLIKQVAECDVRPGGRVVPHLLAQLVADHDRRFLGVGRAAEHELPTGHRVIPGRDPDLVRSAALADPGQVLRRLLPACHNRSV
jgi:hypothetical protein